MKYPAIAHARTQQIGLLFLILFGGLLLVSAGAVFVAMRDKSPQDDHGLTKFAADLRATWIGAAVFWLAWVSGAPGATFLFAVISFLALREFVTLMQTRRADHRSLMLAFFVVLPVQYVLAGAAASTCSRCSSRSTCSWPSPC